jgi:hypothetical protein
MFVFLSGITYYYYYKSKENLIKTEHAFAKWLHVNHTEEENKYESPFQLIPAMKFAGVVVIIKFLA